MLLRTRHVHCVRSARSSFLHQHMATITNNSKGPRRFAPIDSSLPNDDNAPKLRGLVFDVDGTLCLPQNYMFKEMRDALDIPKSVDILEHINGLSDEPDQNSSSSPKSRAQDAIKKIEENAMQHQKPQPGLNELITYLSYHNLRIALCTRNFELPVNHLLEKFVEEQARRNFWPIVTRESKGVKAKPSPEGIWACVDAWNHNDAKLPEVSGETESVLKNTSEEERIKGCEGVIMVGDSVDDVEAGARAGAATVLLVNDENKHLLEEQNWPKKVDLAISRLDDLVDALEKGFCGRT